MVNITSNYMFSWQEEDFLLSMENVRLPKWIVEQLDVL